MDTSAFRIVGIIPARYGASRLPGKALLPLAGKPVVLHVLEQVRKCKVLERVVVATDDQRIFDVITQAGGEAVMTKERHPSGTDRCAETLEKLQEPYDAVINIQGDEPFIEAEQIALVANLLREGAAIATLVKAIDQYDELLSPHTVKVISNRKGQALYFSRHPIPYYRNAPVREWLQHGAYYKHIGMYGYRSDTLRELSKLMVSPLELSESLEQLRWLDHGYEIHTAVTLHESIGIDTEEDLRAAETFLKSHSTRK